MKTVVCYTLTSASSPFLLPTVSALSTVSRLKSLSVAFPPCEVVVFVVLLFEDKSWFSVFSRSTGNSCRGVAFSSV